MKRLLISVMLLIPMPTLGGHLDVIEFRLLEGCSFSKYMEIVGDFNQWGESYGYKAEIAMPLQNENLTSMYWLGTSANAASYGKAWDAWRDALDDPDSKPAKLWARLSDCEENLSRSGFDIY